jgi:hypothetical protein
VIPVETLSFKDHLDLTDRLEIAMEYLKRGGFYGVVIDLANAYSTNRQRIYDILDRISAAFLPRPEEAIEKRIDALEAENAALRARVQALEAKLENSVEVTSERVRDLSLTLTVLPVSYRDIRDIVALAYGEKHVKCFLLIANDGGMFAP